MTAGMSQKDDKDTNTNTSDFLKLIKTHIQYRIYGSSMATDVDLFIMVVESKFAISSTKYIKLKRFEDERMRSKSSVDNNNTSKQ